MVQLNIPYTNKFIAQELFHVKPGSFSAKKQQYLDYLSQYYQYKIQKKKIVLIKEKKPFETRMEKRGSTKERNNQVYRNLTHNIIALQPLNTGANIAREIDQSKTKPFKNHEQGTIENYVRPILKEDFVKKLSRWCFIDYSTNEYVPLQHEQLDYLMKLFKGEIDNTKESQILNQEMMDTIADADAGNISKNEMKEKIADTAWKLYDLRMKQFKKEFGFRPYKTPYWIEKEVENVG